MSGEPAALTRDQMRVVQAVYDQFRELGTWPRFGEVDRMLDRGPRRLDAGKVVQDIPKSILQPLGSSPASSPEYPMRLRLEGVAQAKGSADDVSLFLRSLRWMALQERKFKPTEASATAAATVTSDQLMRAMKIPKRRVSDVSRLGAVLFVEQWGSTGGGHQPDGSWNFSLTRDVRRFSKVQSLDDYRAAQLRWAEEARPRVQVDMLQQSISPGESADNRPAANSSYVDLQVAAAIEAKRATSAWSLHKLLQLVTELNDSYVDQNPYASHALLRAIMDHVAPLFGFTDFIRVVDNHAWGETDKKYMKQLANFKTQADDALHRQIARRPSLLLNMDDLPARRAVNRLLEECAHLL
jgi:hypothetical protein